MFKNRTNNTTPHTSPRPQPSDGLFSPSENHFSPSPSDPPRVSLFIPLQSGSLQNQRWLPRPAADAPTSHNPAPNEDEQEPMIYPKERPMSFMPSSPDARRVSQDQINRSGPASEQAPPRLGIADDDPMPQAQQIHARDEKGHQKNILDDEADITGVFRSETSKRPKPLPPTSAAVESYGALLSPEVLISEQFPPFGPIASNKSAASQKQNEDPTQKPTCTLNLVCYSRGCSLSQIQVTLASKFEKEEQYKKLLAAHPKVITTDRQLFDGLRDRYQNDICGFRRRFFSLKTLRTVRLLSYTSHTRPTPVPFDEMTMREVLYAYNHPSEFGPETDWVEWVFRLRQQDKRHALEFVEGWNGTRIAVLGMIPCVASTLVGVIWSARGGDVQTAFTVAAFILTVATVLLALLAIVSGIDSKPR